MKIFDLRCSNGHEFEGWFASADDYREQLARTLVSCPICGDATLTRLPSAPRLNLGREEVSSARPQPAAGGPATQPVAALPAKRMQAAWLEMMRQVVAHTEDVGPRFAEEARRIHHGEAEDRGIRGQATREETRELLDEGIAVMPLALPDSLKNTLQ